MQLLESTQALLERAKAAGIGLPEIAARSNGNVQYEWLVKFNRGHMENPGVLNVQALHDCLRRLKPKKAA